MVGSTFLILVFLIVDATWALAVEMAMNDAVQEASRLGSLGTTAAGSSREDAIKAAIVARAAGLLDKNNLPVTMQSYGSAYNYGHHAANATQTAGPGSSRHLVQYIVSYTQPLLTPTAITVTGGKTSITHSTVTLVQNEPF